MKMKRRIAIILSMLFALSCATPVWAMDVQEYFLQQGKGGTQDYQKRMKEIEAEFIELDKYTENSTGTTIYIFGEIVGRRSSNEIIVKGEGIVSDAVYFIIKDPDPKYIQMGIAYMGENKLISSDWLSSGERVDYVGPVTKNPYSNQLNALEQEYKNLQKEIKKQEEANANQRVTTSFKFGQYTYYVLDDAIINGMASNGLDIDVNNNNAVSGLAVMEWQGAYFAGEIANGIPNGSGFMIEELPTLGDEGYSSTEFPDMERWNSGLWVDGKYSRLNEYESDRKSTILFELNSPGMWVYEDMEFVEFGNVWARTLSKNGYTMIPIRPLIEAVGGEVQYDGASKMVNMNIEEKTINLTLNKKTAVVNGKSVNMPIAAQIINGKTMIPLRFVSESLGMKVDWDAKEKIVIITYPEGYGKKAVPEGV